MLGLARGQHPAGHLPRRLVAARRHVAARDQRAVVAQRQDHGVGLDRQAAQGVGHTRHDHTQGIAGGHALDDVEQQPVGGLVGDDQGEPVDDPVIVAVASPDLEAATHAVDAGEVERVRSADLVGVDLVPGLQVAQHRGDLVGIDEVHHVAALPRVARQPGDVGGQRGGRLQLARTVGQEHTDREGGQHLLHTIGQHPPPSAGRGPT
nr:hypothetical protein [Iamia sp. SCSIO 61187]